MYASVKETSPYKTITACGGLTFTKGEWRAVPRHEEAAAKDNPYLETADKLPKDAQPAARLIVPAPKVAANEGKTVRLVRRGPGGEEQEDAK